MTTTTNTEHLADVAILIALEEEWEVFWPIAGEPSGVKDDSGGYLYHFDGPTAAGRPYRCVALFMGAMGPGQATHATARLLAAKPRTLVNLGIAAAIHDDLRLCDVVVAEQVDDFLSTVKAVPKGESEWTFELRGSVYRTTHALVQDLTNLRFAHRDAFSWWRSTCGAAMSQRASQLAKALAAKHLREAPAITKVHLASGPVLAAAEAFSKWVRTTRDGLLKALEMEAAGMMLAAHQQADPARTLVLRGISDFGDERKVQTDLDSGGAFRHLAMFNATQLLWAMMHQGLLPRHEPTGGGGAKVPADGSPPGRVNTEDTSAEAAGVGSSAQRRQMSHDLFLSYRTRHAARIEPLITALAAEGVRVWRHRDRIHNGDSITAERRAGLAASRALAVFATEDYADSRTCAWELASAWIAAERQAQTVQRILMLRPDGGELGGDVGPFLDHAAFAVLADEPAAAAYEIARHLETCGALTLGELVELGSSPRWFPYHRSGSSRFVGRLGDLWDLHGRLVRSRQVGVTGQVGHSIVQVRGLGGIGKTLFVLEYARRFEVAWPGGIFWFDADDNWSADAEPSELLERRYRLLAGLAGALGVQQVLGDLAATAHAVATALLARTGGRPYLWILDNVPPGTTQRAIDALMPPDSRGALVLTTRWRALNSLGAPLDLGVLRFEEALALLTTDRPPRGEDELTAAGEVVEAVGRHAYALDVLRALVRDAATTTTPYRTWARRLADIQDDTLDDAAKDLAEELPTGKARAISAVFADSLDGRSEAALDVLRLAAVLADAPCPGEFVAAVLERRGHGTAAVERAVGELAAHALIINNLEVPGIHVHSLVRRVATRWRCDQARLDELSAQAQEILNQRFRDIDPLDLRQHPSLLPLLPHANELAAASTILAARLGVNVGNFIMERGNFALARIRFEAARATFEREEGVDSSHYLGTLTNLAGCIQEQGDLIGACAIYETVLAARLQNLGAEDRCTLEAQQNLAVAVTARGDYPRARELLERALSSAIRQFGAMDPIALIIELNLATVEQAQGKLAQALDRTRRVFDGMSHVHGPEHPKTTHILSNMAGLLATMGDLSTARRHFEQVLKIDERDKGPEHPDTLQDRQNLADLLYRAGDWARARASEEDVLAARERVLGPEHPKTLETRKSLAVTCERLGDFAAALLHTDRAHEGLERALGPQHPKTLVYSHNRAILARSLGDLEQARQIEEIVFAGLTLRLGSDHPWTLTSKHHLAELMRERGESKAACDLYSEVLSARQRLLGGTHPDTLNTKRGLAGALIDLGDVAGAREIFEDVLSVMEELLPNHPDTITTRYNLVFVLKRIDPALAEPYMPKLRALSERKLDELSPIERDIVKKLARIESLKIEFHPSPVAPEARGRRRRPRSEKK